MDEELVLTALSRGIRGGVVQGATDEEAGYPLAGRTEPRDYMATVLHLMGIDPESTPHDPQGRPFPASRGHVNSEIVT